MSKLEDGCESVSAGAPIQNASNGLICTWSWDEYHFKWDTTCNNAFQFMGEGGPVDHGFTHCPYCGGSLKADAPTAGE